MLWHIRLDERTGRKRSSLWTSVSLWSSLSPGWWTFLRPNRSMKYHPKRKIIHSRRQNTFLWKQFNFNNEIHASWINYSGTIWFGLNYDNLIFFECINILMQIEKVNAYTTHERVSIFYNRTSLIIFWL